MKNSEHQTNHAEHVDQLDTAHQHEHHEDHEHTDHMQHMEHSGHEGHEGHMDHSGHGGHMGHVAMYRRLFWIMLVIAIPVVIFNDMFADIIGYTLPDGSWVKWVSPILGTVMYIWGGRPFLTGAVDELKQRSPGMMMLVSLAITVAFFASWAATLGLVSHELNFWWEMALLIVIMLLGHWIEMRSLAQTSSALESLAELLPDTAEKLDASGEITSVAPSDLAVGDVVLVRPGATVPADGEIINGEAHLDESMITGESRAVRRGEGDNIVAGTVSTDSALQVKVTAVGDDTTLAGIRKLVSDAQNSSSRAQRIADKASGWLFWYAVIAAIITAIVWTALGYPESAVVRTITVLVIACPHALGLAIPLVVSISTERAARGGVLIKDRLALENMRNVDTVLFDKTGTLTEGSPEVTAIVPASDEYTEDQILQMAASAESPSEHPLATAIVRSAEARGLEQSVATDFSSAPAVGVRALIDDRVVQVGGPYLLEQEGATELHEVEQWRDEGAIILHVLVDGKVIGALRLADAIRPESREAVDALHKLGIQVVMITGDAEAVANSVASELGIDRVFAGVRPEDKSAKVAELQEEGRTVAMVGDGVNDAPALAKADVGIAIGAGTDVAVASAGVVLASSDPRSVVSVIELSNASYRKMVQNLWWAAGYNLISVPLAAGVLAPIGFILPMSVGAILMSLSTVVVALNAQTLRRLDLSPEASTARVLEK
ncbi:heavy metal translocating P-type ATPase [Corynebacterium sp. S7]